MDRLCKLNLTPNQCCVENVDTALYFWTILPECAWKFSICQQNVSTIFLSVSITELKCGI